MHETEEIGSAPSGRLVFYFGDGGCEGDPQRKDILGGKGASLAAMCCAGLPVPPGFTISVACCKHYQTHGGQWPAGLEDQVRRHIARLEESTGRKFGRGADPLLVSVRSGAAVSMPGMMDTILNCGLHPGLESEVPDKEHFWLVYGQFIRQFGTTVARIPASEFDKLSGAAEQPREFAEACIRLYEQTSGRKFPVAPWEALRECINAVFESWNNERAIVYRKAHGLQGVEGTAVNVQSMFNSEVSGIAFTANPAKPMEQEIVIESSYGLGESIVSGEVTPDRFVLDRGSLQIKERALGSKGYVVAALGGGRGAERDPNAASLTDEQIGEVGRIAMEVEEYFGFPVDIEWGLADGRFSLLQSRAIRGLDVARDVEVGRREEVDRLRQLASGNGKVWIVHNLSETLEAPTPLTWDIIRVFMRGAGGFGQMYRDFGYRPSRRVIEEGFLELICGRVFADADRAAEVFWEGMPFQYDHQEVLANPRLMESAPKKFDAKRADGRFLVRLPGTLYAMIRCVRKMKKARARAKRIFDEQALPPFRGYVEAKGRQDLAALSTAGVIEDIHERMRTVLTDFGKESLKPGFFGGLARAELEQTLIQLLGPVEGQRMCQVLTSGLNWDPTVELNAMLFRVARGEVRMEDFLERFGHRAVDEMELAKPRWREDASYLRQIVENQNTSEEHSPASLHQKNQHRREQAMTELPDILARWGGSSLYEQVRDLAIEAQELLPYREAGKNYLLMGYELIRTAILELGRRWELSDDVFFLRLEELPTFESDSDNLTAEMQKRRIRWQAFRRLDLPDVIDSAELDTLGLPRHLEAASEMEAVTLSPGVVTGTARIIFSPSDAKNLGDDCILVCPSTDPSWTALFTTIKGLVVERGGVLSHGAITARDFSIPAVACPDTTQTIKDGAKVRVDGDRGHISIIEE
ncbi:MAG TPA: PEP/pyruvate-binding domain-containing protein [Phycisphaerae bacterium]|nr:PEP/pyruvate-binding domain-containing protein [Phycisphaerae bacterium]